MMAASCDSPEKRTMRELSRAGIEPSGRSLMEAVEKNDRKNMGLLLEMGVHTEHRDKLGRTPLRIAVDKGMIDTAYQLLEAGADPNGICADGIGILGKAIFKNQVKLVERLIESGARADGKMPGGDNILIWCIRENRPELVKSLFERGADPHMKDSGGDPLIHFALGLGNRSMVELLIEQGANPASLDSRGRGLLVLAMERGWKDLLPALAAAGADPNLVSPAGTTLLEDAIVAKDVEMIEMLKGLGADQVCAATELGARSPLRLAIVGGDMATIEAVLGEGERLDGDEWEAALWYAYGKRDPALGRILLANGAFAEGRDSGGLLLVERAVIDQRDSWVKLMLDYGHEPGHSIYYACSRGDHFSVELLLGYGESVDHTIFPFKDTAFMMALRRSHDKTAAKMIRHAAKYGQKLGSNELLHLAIVTENAETVRELLAAGADANAPITQPVSEDFLRHVKSKDMKWYLVRDRNITPLMLAANVGDLASARYLLDVGASKHAYTRVNKTWPINFASRRSDVAMMRLLLGKDPHRRERHIELSIGEQHARVYNQDGEEIFSTKVSTGKKGFATRQGEFVITNKHRHHTSNIYHASMPYFQRLSCGDFGFHYGYVPGYPASHGCIRLPMESARKLFAMTEVGDTVRIKP
jgi:ankyrin repeat protein